MNQHSCMRNFLISRLSLEYSHCDVGHSGIPDRCLFRFECTRFWFTTAFLRAPEFSGRLRHTGAIISQEMKLESYPTEKMKHTQCPAHGAIILVTLCN